jgi:hypothetical protein
MTIAPISSKYYMVCIRGGIFYYEFYHILSVDSVLESEKMAFKMLQENHISLIPAIVQFKNMDEDNVRASLLDLGKIFTAHDIMKYNSGLWFVNATGKIRKMSEMLNKIFLGGKANFVETLEEAEAGARKARDTETPILEQLDRDKN